MAAFTKFVRLSRRLLVPLLVSTVLTPAPSQAAFPDRLLTIVVGFPPGSPNDVLARSVADRLRRRTGQPVIVENRPGAAGMTATLDFVNRAPRDGYRLLVGSVTLGTALAIRKNHPGFDAREDLTPLVMINMSPMAITIPSALPVQNLAEFISYVRARPGQLNYASAGGVGGAVHLLSALFLQTAGLDMVHIPYPGSPAAVPAVMSNDVQLFIVDNSSVLGGLQTGNMRALAVASTSRIDTLPDVPTAAEAGLPFEAAAWYGLFAPRGIPDDIRAALEAQLSAVVQDPSFQAEIRARGGIPGTLTGEAFRQLIRDEVVKWENVVRQANIPQE
ncbi:Bug family tripartite tricarboxylate transporter substrate binding protein [Humitalea sp. 24SJ18S-53]|uniref:Bug family tripartite tricarboxylate transporter substrate binding protein n=1 Tax=Humitalea sp. 24SJ18S-53 TaxID=3422307 RepID=UPI003D664754